MANRNSKRPANGYHDFSNKKPRHQDKNSSPFVKAPEPIPAVTLSTAVPPPPQIDEKYSEAVFTHISVASQKPTNPQLNSYDQLEFLGDAYLEVVASQLIFDRFTNLSAGRMSQIRESLVKNETLARLTEAYGWDRRIKNGQVLQKESSQAWVKIKGDVFEAYVAAVVLSHTDGLQIAKTWLEPLWEPILSSFAAKNPASDKSKVHLAQKIAGKDVKISYVDEKPPVVHKGQGVETYFVGAYLTGWGWDNQFLGSGKGLSRNGAGQEAAAAALKNHPLIDEIIAKKAVVLAEVKKEVNK